MIKERHAKTEAEAAPEKTRDAADVQTQSPKAKDLTEGNNGHHRNGKRLCGVVLPECH